jgi:outer membrane protein OmpA-like peptidoglycan-associated protein
MGKTYTVRYEADGFRPYNEIISVTPEGEYKEVDKDYDFKNLGNISVFGKVATRTGEKIPGVKITAKDNISKKTIGIFSPRPDGTYSFDLPGKGGESYSFTYEAEGYLPMNESLDVPASLVDYDFKKDIIMETSKMLGTISVSGMLTDKEKVPLKLSRIVVVDNKTAETIGTYTPTDKGAYYFNLERGKDYNVSYEAEGYLFQSENINVPKDRTYSEIIKDIQLEKIKKGAKIVLNNIFFDSGKSTLRKESNIEIDKLVKIINDNGNLKVEVSGHTDNAGKPDANLKLSQARAEEVASALIRRGADKGRVTAQGYGDTQPIAPNKVNGKPNQKNMQLNRRVEFKILDN